MRSITVSAPSKLHLSGEHVVVYGKPAVLIATNRRLEITLTRIKNNELGITNNIENIRSKDKYIDHICQIFEKKYSVFINHYSLFINSEIPVGRGMGSSAALAVALISALTKFYKKPWNLGQINELAYQAEKFVHKNSSGGDVSIVTHGGILWYRREFEFLKTFWSLPIKFPNNLNKFVLINTGRSETTGEMVNLVNVKLKVHSSRLQMPEHCSGGQVKIKIIFQQIEETTKQIIMAIKTVNEQLFKDSIRKNEHLLEKLGVVSKPVQKLIREIEKSGGAAKISGAGGIKTGSGIVIGYHSDIKIIEKLAQKYKYPYFQTKLGEEGVRVERLLI